MMIITDTSKESIYNRPLYGFHGSYTLSEGVSLPYFLTAMSIDRAIDEIKIAEQVPVNINNKWSLSELFQREVDGERVGREMVTGYLADPGKLKFFNAITVVLMPKGDDESIQDRFEEAVTSPPIPFEEGNQTDSAWKQDKAVVKCVKGVQYVTIGESARLRWDKDVVHAVVVDGQHRLVSLRQYKEKNKLSVFSKEEQETKIPVIIVLLDERLGFVNKRETYRDIRLISRELFTDLNKNAKPVDKARELILDDWSISARCVRTLITNETAVDEQGKLPLSFVRWQDDKNRFDSDYYLNSLVHLDVLINEILDIKHPKDPFDRRSVDAFINSIESVLAEPSKGLIANNRSLQDVYEQDYLDEEGEPQRPLSRIPTAFLGEAIEGFKKYHKPWIVKILTEFEPYRNLLTYARDNDLIEGVFGNFYAQTQKHRNAILGDKEGSDWHSEEILVHSAYIEKNIKNITIEREGHEEVYVSWGFKTIFQKALVLLAKDVSFVHDDLGGIDKFLEVMNGLYKKELLFVGSKLEGHKEDLWAYLATNPGNKKIKVAKKTQNTIKAVLTVWYYTNLLLESEVTRLGLDELEDSKFYNKNLEISFPNLYKYFSSSTQNATWPGVADAIGGIRSAIDVRYFYNSVSNKDYEELSEQEKEDYVKQRVVGIMKSGVLDDFVFT